MCNSVVSRRHPILKSSLALNIFPSSLPYTALSLEGRVLINAPYLELSASKSFALWTLSSCGSLCWLPATARSFPDMRERGTDLWAWSHFVTMFTYQNNSVDFPLSSGSITSQFLGHVRCQQCQVPLHRVGLQWSSRHICAMSAQTLQTSHYSNHRVCSWVLVTVDLPL